MQLTDRHILGNIRRTLHDHERSAFSAEELELILFVELKGGEVDNIDELRYLPNIETLTLKNTRVEDLSPIAGCGNMHTLILLENGKLDYRTLPALPGLSTLSVSGDCTGEDVGYLEALLPECSIYVY